MTDNTIVFHEPVRPGDVLTHAPDPALGERREDDQARHRALLGHRRRVHEPGRRDRRGRELHRLRLPARRRRPARRRVVSALAPVLVFGDVAEGDLLPSLRLRRDRHHGRARRAGHARLAAHAPRQGLRRRAQRHPGHLPQHPQPGGVVRALHHGLDRAPRPAGPGHLPHARLGVPRRHHGLRRGRGRRRRVDDTGCGWVGLDITLVGRRRREEHVHRPGGAARGRRRQPLAPRRRDRWKP